MDTVVVQFVLDTSGHAINRTIYVVRSETRTSTQRQDWPRGVVTTVQREKMGILSR